MCALICSVSCAANCLAQSWRTSLANHSHGIQYLHVSSNPTLPIHTKQVRGRGGCPSGCAGKAVVLAVPVAFTMLVVPIECWWCWWWVLHCYTPRAAVTIAPYLCSTHLVSRIPTCLKIGQIFSTASNSTPACWGRCTSITGILHDTFSDYSDYLHKQTVRVYRPSINH